MLKIVMNMPSDFSFISILSYTWLITYNKKAVPLQREI